MNTTQISEMETRFKKSQSERKICVNPPLQFFMSVYLQRMSLCLFSQSLLCFSEPHTPFYIGGFSLFLCSPTIGHLLVLYYTIVRTKNFNVKIFTTLVQIKCCNIDITSANAQKPIWRNGKSILVNVSKYEMYPLSHNVESIGWSARMDWRELDSCCTIG